ncbi:MAG: hypothetical protein ABL907_21540, partial [Hyphomicrobium sp.]
MTQQHAVQRVSGGVPDWDRKAVAGPYLRQLRQQASFGTFHRGWVDGMFTELAAELRAAYDEDAGRAMVELERVFANIDQVARKARIAAQFSERDLSESQIARVLPRWQALTRPRILARVDTKVFADRGGRAIQGVVAGVGAVAGFGAEKVQHIRQASNQRREARIKQNEALRLEAIERLRQQDEQDKDDRRAKVADCAAPVVTADLPTLAPARERRLNGAAMQTSTFSTWLMLVVLSWFSLLWGALLSMPFGVGLGIL